MKNIPILEALREYNNSLPSVFHMPGHKLGKGFNLEEFRAIGKFDLTEIPGTDNLHYPEGAILEAQRLAAQGFGADETFFLVNGSTCGIHAAIMSVCREGDKLIVSRDCHKAAIAGLMLAKAEPIYVKPEIDSLSKVPLGADVDAIIKAMDDYNDAVGVLITRPNYYGICCCLDKLVLEAHKRGKIIIVDEAHGAHLRFHNELPICAMDADADICIQSAHKTLPALTQSAMLHIKGNRVDRERVAFYLRILQTTSPSYILMASIDIAREIMQREGFYLLQCVNNNVKFLEDELIDNQKLKFFKNTNNSYKKDYTRVVINATNLGLTGYEMDKILRQDYSIQVEMSDFYNIVLILTVSDTEEDFKRLTKALKDLSSKFRYKEILTDIKIKDIEIPPKGSLNYNGFFSTKWLPLKEAESMQAADIITPYPPGIPAICPGEIIMADSIEFLYNIINAGGVVNGLTADTKIRVIIGDR